MTDQSDVRSLGKRRRTALRVFYGFVVAAIAAFTLGARASDSRGAMTAIGILLAGGALWSFFASSEPQTHIGNSSTMKRRVLPLLPLCFYAGCRTPPEIRIVSGASLLVPALMIAFWSIGLILASWRYQ